eukprot:scaffold3142_cov416-Prasinococcus_capsulatus_cf.AAC.4
MSYRVQPACRSAQANSSLPNELHPAATGARSAARRGGYRYVGRSYGDSPCTRSLAASEKTA